MSLAAKAGWGSVAPCAGINAPVSSDTETMPSSRIKLEMPTPRRLFIALQPLKKRRCGGRRMRLVVSYEKAWVALDSNYFTYPFRSYTR